MGLRGVNGPAWPQKGICQMKKAIVIGGSNGIGLAIAEGFAERNYDVLILDKVAPDRAHAQADEHISFRPCDLLELDDDWLAQLSRDEQVEALMITAGLGRVADFAQLHPAEIQNTMQINATSSIRIIRHFYERLKGDAPFYCGIMGSIAGHVSSPLFSVYAASKAAVCRFVESVNIELEASGAPGRILDVSPGSIKGTRFNGGPNDPQLTRALAEDIIGHLLARDTLFIPEYETIYRSVIERYQKDRHEYGLHSYAYKKASGRAGGAKRFIVGYLSGTFDLFHVGHLNLIRRAKKQCDYLIVGVHPTAAHKGKETFIPFDERMEIVQSIRYVDKAVPSCAEDSDAWAKYHYDRLFVGDDYKGSERFMRYEAFFRDKGVEIIYFPYTQGTSSTQLRGTISSTLDRA